MIPQVTNEILVLLIQCVIPAPVVLLRLFYVHNAGMDKEWSEEIQNYEYASCNYYYGSCFNSLVDLQQYITRRPDMYGGSFRSPR